MDDFQDVFFLRRDGIVSDENWDKYKAHMKSVAQRPAFQLIFEYALKQQLLHPEFVQFFRPILKGNDPQDPRTANKRDGSKFSP